MPKILGDGRIDLSQDLTNDELELMAGWYAGQWDPLYAIQSSGTCHPQNLSAAACNLSRDLKHMSEDEKETAELLIARLEGWSSQYCKEEE